MFPSRPSVRNSLGYGFLCGLLWLPVVADAPAQAEALEQMAARILAQQSSTDRHQYDLPRDPGRKPYAAFLFLGVKEGMTVLDVGAFAGYTTEMLAAAVGSTGVVYSHNTQRVLTRFAEGYYQRTMDERLANDRLPNVRMHISDYLDLGLERQVDVAFLGNLLHDLYYDEGQEYTVRFLQQIAQTLKPDGIFGITDHVGIGTQDNAKLHRIVPSVVSSLLTDAGFEVVSTSQLYANPEDDHTLMVYNELIYRQTDRLFYKARKVPDPISPRPGAERD